MSKTWFFTATFIFSTLIVIYIWWQGRYLNFSNPTDISNIAIEFHGMVFDIFVFGIVLTVYESFIEGKRKKEREELDRLDKIERLMEEIDEKRSWDEKEAMIKITGLIKKLNKMGVSEIDFKDCYLENANLKESNLRGAKFQNANFQGANLFKVNLQNANLQGANFQNAILTTSNLQGAKLEGVNLKFALLGATNLEKFNLFRTNFQEAHLSGANLNGASLIEANFNGAKLMNANLKNVELVRTRLLGAELKGAQVDKLDWLDRQTEQDVIGIEEIKSKYYVAEVPQIEQTEEIKFILREFLPQEYESSEESLVYCSGYTKKGLRCKNRAKSGTDKCSHHSKV